MNAREVAAARLIENTHHVDHGVSATRQPPERFLIVNVGLDDIDGRKQDQVFRILASTRRHNDPAAGGGKLARDVPANEAATAKYKDRSIAHRESSG
jgi:hypothetical protein